MAIQPRALPVVHGATSGRAACSAFWLGAEQGEHTAVRVGEVRDNHAVLEFHRRDDDLAAEFLAPGGGRGDVCDLDDENSVWRNIAACVEDATGGSGGARGGDERVRPVEGE